MNSEKTTSTFRPNKGTDYSAIYKREFAEDSLDPHCRALIKGQLGKKGRRPKVAREVVLAEIKERMETNMKHLILGSED